MTESEARMQISKNQNEILKRIFENISEDGFDLNLNLDDIDSEELKDFWVYTAGFMSVQNFESDESFFTEDDFEDIMNGNFYLKEVTLEEAETLVKQAGKRIKPGGYSQIVPLYKIQDGEYFFYKNVAVNRNGRQYIGNIITLTTNKPEFETKRPYFENEPDQILKIIRNLLVHRTPYINGSKLTLFDDKDSVQITKMWLRGYSELFSQRQVVVSANEIKNILHEELPKQGNYIDSFQDIDKALSLVMHCFNKATQEKYYRVNNFVKRRIPFNKDFFKKSLDEKIEIIAQICESNPTALSSSNQKMNPAVIYNLQQLVSKELDARGEEAILTEDDYDSDKLIELYFEQKEVTKRCDDFDAKHPVIRTQFERMQNNKLIKDLNVVLNKFKKQEEFLKNRKKLASSHMNLYHIEGLEKLPVEVALNTVCLMGYNSLVTSAFFEDLLAVTDFNNLNPAQRKFFSKFNMDNLTTTYWNKKSSGKYTPEEKAFMLSCIRNAICHDQITFTLPTATQGDNIDFKKVIINFTADWDRTVISGTVEEFYKLFGLNMFHRAREKSIITGEQYELPENIEEENEGLQSIIDDFKKESGDDEPNDEPNGSGPVQE